MISIQQRMDCSREILAHGRNYLDAVYMISIQQRMAYSKEIAHDKI